MAMTVSEIRAMLREADECEFAALERSLAADQRKGVRDAVEVARRRIASEKSEIERVRKLYEYQDSFLHEGQRVIVGLDEVGRGAVAGPLAVGAVVLASNPVIAGLNDSKQLSPEQRTAIAQTVKATALAWAVAYVEPADIDKDGMTASLKRAFTEALASIESTGVIPDVVLVDGNPLHIDEREVNVVKGDSKCASIAAASIIAKVSRDALMCDLASSYPGYGLEGNKGYGSQQHIDAIKQQGLSRIHRKSFCRSFMQESLF